MRRGNGIVKSGSRRLRRALRAKITAEVRAEFEAVLATAGFLQRIALYRRVRAEVALRMRASTPSSRTLY